MNRTGVKIELHWAPRSHAYCAIVCEVCTQTNTNVDIGFASLCFHSGNEQITVERATCIFPGATYILRERQSALFLFFIAVGVKYFIFKYESPGHDCLSRLTWMAFSPLLQTWIEEYELRIVKTKFIFRNNDAYLGYWGVFKLGWNGRYFSFVPT